ncbi:MAG TPA: hypothetical protein EYG60_01575 [Campylobacterales bacterium]|nr:hypothetical protein [Campylobacterales bacterium]
MDKRQRIEIKPLFDTIDVNFSIANEATEYLQKSIKNIKKIVEEDILNQRNSSKDLNYIIRDIKNNLEFTLYLVDEINRIDEVVNQINVLALNTAIEASKVDGEASKIFGNIAREVREKSDQIQEIITYIFNKEVKNKSFTEHNRYIKNSVLGLLEERGENITKYLNTGEQILRYVKKLEDWTKDIANSNDGNRELVQSLQSLLEECNSLKIAPAQKPKEQKPQEEILNEESSEEDTEEEQEQKEEKQVERKKAVKSIIRNVPQF